ncbi:MAG: SGNH/GDSL hydrolase family protein [Abitibacteriaceae bacterium]|nr:SGNH/GDSL hydrolase family protein [Abditibacteriaceae bacterium]
MSHIILLGDSILDNAAYVSNGPDVIHHLRQRLPQGWRATLCAVDGDVIQDVHQQLKDVPGDATHLVISVGGNDALGQAGVLGESASSVAAALTRLATIRDQFESGYQQMLEAVLKRGLPTAVCTIYYPQFPDVQLQRIAVAALTLFNDCILRLAFAHGIPVLDLRLICNEAGDYANQIEPSAQGGGKIAAVIAQVVTQHDFSTQRTILFI